MHSFLGFKFLWNAPHNPTELRSDLGKTTAFIGRHGTRETQKRLVSSNVKNWWLLSYRRKWLFGLIWFYPDDDATMKIEPISEQLIEVRKNGRTIEVFKEDENTYAVTVDGVITQTLTGDEAIRYLGNAIENNT